MSPFPPAPPAPPVPLPPLAPLTPPASAPPFAMMGVPPATSNLERATVLVESARPEYTVTAVAALGTLSAASCLTSPPPPPPPPPDAAKPPVPPAPTTRTRIDVTPAGLVHVVAVPRAEPKTRRHSEPKSVRTIPPLLLPPVPSSTVVEHAPFVNETGAADTSVLINTETVSVPENAAQTAMSDEILEVETRRRMRRM